MNDKTESQLREMVEDSPASFDDAVTAFEEAVETVADKVVEDLSDDRIERMALLHMRASDIEADRTTRGEGMDLQVLAIGSRLMQWSDGDGGKKDVVIAYGVIHAPGRRLPTSEGGEGPEVALGMFILDSSKGVDPGDAMRRFSALNALTGRFSVSPSSDLSQVGETMLYRCESTTKTVLADATEDEMDLPTDRDAKNQILRSRIPQATLGDAATDAAQVLSAYDPETGYAEEFGADLRRIRGTVVDYYVDDEGGWGRYTLLDDTILEDDLPGSDIMPDPSDSRGAPGLTAWADPQYHINYGRKSQCDFYGSLSASDDGEVQLNVVGVVPILPMPLDEQDAAGGASNANTTETSI